MDFRVTEIVSQNLRALWGKFVVKLERVSFQGMREQTKKMQCLRKL